MTSLSRLGAIALASSLAFACNTTPTADANVEAAPAPRGRADTASTDANRAQPASSARIDTEALSRPGYFVEVRDGRLWVFLRGTQDFYDFQKMGEPAKLVTMIHAGPGGLTLRGPDRETLVGYMASSPRFHARVIDGRLWVFDLEKEDYRKAIANGPSDKRVTLIGKGPDGMTLCAAERETLDDWMYQAPGFHTAVEDGRLWVLQEGTEELESFLTNGPSDKCVTLIKAGPGGITVRAPSMEVAQAYLAAKGLR
jgi:hypothetical protein